MRVLTIGTFDLIHDGHRRLFARASLFGDVYVGVNSDRFVREYKGRPPECSENLRLFAVEHDPFVSRVRLNDGPGIDLIRAVEPNLLVVGSDWLGRDYPAQLGTTADELAALRVGVLFLPRTPGISTTQLREQAA